MTQQRDAMDPIPTKVDSETLRAAMCFLDAIGARYAVREAYLFGSRARGTHRPDSDADIALILLGETGNRGAAIIDMAGIAFDVMMSSGILIATPLWEGEFDAPKKGRASIWSATFSVMGFACERLRLPG